MPFSLFLAFQWNGNQFDRLDYKEIVTWRLLIVEHFHEIKSGARRARVQAKYSTTEPSKRYNIQISLEIPRFVCFFKNGPLS